ncbi:MAG: hypothetical protein ABUL77_02250 [Bacteroidota bacterium]
MAELSTAGELVGRFLRRQDQTRSARSVELFGWLDLVLGNLIFFAPQLTETVLGVPPLVPQGESFLRLVGLLVSGLGMLYIVSGRLNAEGFVFASMLDRPLVPVVMAVLWCRGIMPGGLAVAFSVSDFGGFLFTLFAWRAERRTGAPNSKQTEDQTEDQTNDGASRGSGFARALGAVFGFTSGVSGTRARSTPMAGPSWRRFARWRPPIPSWRARAKCWPATC